MEFEGIKSDRFEEILKKENKEYKIVKKVWVEYVRGASFCDTTRDDIKKHRIYHYGNIKLHKENPKNKESTRCLAPFEGLEDFHNENNLAQTEPVSRRIICIEIDNLGIVRKVTEEGEQDLIQEGVAFPIDTEAIFNNNYYKKDEDKKKYYVIIGKPMPKISELEEGE